MVSNSAVKSGFVRLSSFDADADQT